MRKHFLILMLLTLLPLAGWAQFGVGNWVQKGNFIYEITKAAVGEDPGEVVLYGIRDGYNPVNADKALVLEGAITIQIVDGPSFDFIVKWANADALQKTFTFNAYNVAPTPGSNFAGRTTAESVVIPKEFREVLANTFYGYTNIKSISFEANSEVTTIYQGAFNTTQISSFDFSNCSKLTTIHNGLFVEPAPAINSYVTEIILPTGSTALTTIGTAFQRLPNLTKIENLDQSKITVVEAEAFSGDAKLTTLAFPGTVQTIEDDAFKNSGLTTLTIDVTSMLNLGEGGANGVYGSTAADKLKLASLTLKGVLSGTIEDNAFKGLTNLATLDMTDMTINGGTIDASAFQGCTKLGSLTFNDITEGTIGANAFQGCTSLASVEFGNITGTDVQDALIDDNAFQGCTKLATITFGNLHYVTIDVDAFKGCGTAATATTLGFGTLNDVDINATAFTGCTKMTSIVFGASENLAIAASAFENSASAGDAATLTFGNAKNITIAVDAFKGATKLATISFGDIEDDAIASNEIAGGAFENCTGLTTLSFGNLKDVQIMGNAFKAATSALNGTNYASAIFGNLEGSTIFDDAFVGASRLNTVTIGDVKDGSVIGQGAAAVFPAVKTVTIGTVEGAANTIATFAFTYADQSGATLNLASADEKYLKSSAADMIIFGAFDFKAVVNAGASASFVYPVVNIGEIKSTNVFATGALKGNNIRTINFLRDIVTAGLNKRIIVKSGVDAVGDLADDATDIAGTTLRYLTFNGALATGAIGTGAFSELPYQYTITFNGDLADGAIAANSFNGLQSGAVNAINFNGAFAAGAIAANAFANLAAATTITFNSKLPATAVVNGAFEQLPANSQIVYAYNGEDIDLTVNPFAKRVFDNTTAYVDQDGDADVDIDDIDIQTPRDIKFAVTNAALKAKFEGATGFGTDGAFDVYRAYFFVPVVNDFSFLVYPDLKTTKTQAWARWELGSREAEGSAGLAAGTSLVIKRVQQIDGTNNAKITVYGTYTDEDDAMNATTVYMMPLKVQNGYYHIPGANTQTLIVKVENKGADFTEKSYKVKVNQVGYDVYDAGVTGNGSIWPGLVNDELFIAKNIMTNQQLCDKTAWDDQDGDAVKDVGEERDIYRGGTAIAEDLYIMTDPSKNKGFRIDKTAITNTNNAYINEGWYYMLLKKYEGAAAAARVIWLDDMDNTDPFTAIKELKSQNNSNVVKANDVMYNLSGQKVGADYKGIVIKNGKKFVIK